MTKEAISKAPEGRVKRASVRGRNILTVKGKDPNYVYRVVNDTDDRIMELQERGYVVDTDQSVEVGDPRVSSGTPIGTTKQLSVGRGIKAYIMKIKREYYDEDVKEKMDFVDAQESAMKKKALDGTYGKLDVTRD